MSARKIVALCFLVTSVACKRPAETNAGRNATPAALQKQKISYSESRFVDPITALYTEVSEKTPALKKLNKDIDEVDQMQTDSAQAFKEYNEQVLSYYRSAETHIRSVADSALRNLINTRLAQSRSAYLKRTERNVSLLNQSDISVKQLHDLHTAVKVLYTLPMIEQYQKNELPDTHGMQAFLLHLNKLKTAAEKQMNK